jgi:hypothetical protein
MNASIVRRGNAGHNRDRPEPGMGGGVVRDAPNRGERAERGRRGRETCAELPSSDTPDFRLPTAYCPLSAMDCPMVHGQGGFADGFA